VQCLGNYQSCINGTKNRQQTPPPPCTGIRCTLPKAHPPTSVSPTTTKRPRPVKPVAPVGVSNPNKTNTGDSGSEILLRKNDSGGGKNHGR
jgi:hypothetical protein